MKVCFFSQFSATNNAGASLSMFNIADELVKQGTEVSIVLANRNNLKHLEKNHQIRYIIMPFYCMRMTVSKLTRVSKLKFAIKYLYNKITVVKIARLLRHEHIDVIHINGLDTPIGAEVAKVLKIPYVWHIRQFIEDDFGQKIFNQKYLYKLVHDANEVIAISNDVKRKFEPIINRSIKVIYNGVPKEKYNIPDHQILTGESVRCLLAGRISIQKGQMTAIQAIEILVQRGMKQIHLTLIGETETKEYLKDLEDYINVHNLQEYVSVMEHADDLLELRRTHDIGLTCSQREAFGRVTVENMMAGMLAIGANSGGTVEIIKDQENGMLYEANNAASLADVILKAVSDQQQSQRIAQNGYRYSINSYSIDRVVNEVRAVYNSVSNK